MNWSQKYCIRSFCSLRQYIFVHLTHYTVQTLIFGIKSEKGGLLVLCMYTINRTLALLYGLVYAGHWEEDIEFLSLKSDLDGITTVQRCNRHRSFGTSLSFGNSPQVFTKLFSACQGLPYF